MPPFTVGNYLATRLDQIGVKHYFVVPGDFNLILLDQLLENKSMEQIGCCNELNAAYAAEGYARINGCGAVVTTMNVGAFSALDPFDLESSLRQTAFAFAGRVTTAAGVRAQASGWPFED